MTLIEILVSCEFVAILLVGYVLKKQSDSQKEIISNLKEYAGIINVKKLKKYVEFGEEATLLKAVTMVKSGLKPEIDAALKTAISEVTKHVNENYLGFVNFTVYVILASEPEEREQIIELYFPNQREMIEDYLNRAK